MTRFLRFLSVLCMALFVGNAFAATGYVCESYRKYTSCAEGYYMTSSASSATYNGTVVVGNACRPCSLATITVQNYTGATTISPAFCPGGTESPIYEITLDANGGTLASTFNELYFQASPHRFCTDYTDCEGTDITGEQLTESQLPTRAPTTSGATTTRYTFAGFATEPNLNDGEIYISSSGAVDESDYTLGYATTWYAQWSETTVTGCPAGKYVKDGECEACPAGTYQNTDMFTGDACTACGAGKWSNAGASSCSSITAGCYGTSGTKDCPAVCGAGEYSVAGASECTSCPTGYTTSSDLDPADHAGARSCETTCTAGTAVLRLGGQCVSTLNGLLTTTYGWFTEKHTVVNGDVSPVSYCPYNFSASSDNQTACGACRSASQGAGKSISTVLPGGTYIRIRSVGQQLKIYNIVARTADGDELPGVLSLISSTDVTNVDGVMGGNSAPGIFGADAEYIVQAQSAAVASIEISFIGTGKSSSSESAYYAIETSPSIGDNATWTTMFNSYMRRGLDTSSWIGFSDVMYKKRFILFSERQSGAGYYAPEREIRLCPVDSPTNMTANGGGLTKCPTTYPNSAASAEAKTECYANCDMSTLTNGTVVAARTEKVYYSDTPTSDNVCHYNVSCNDGYHSQGSNVIIDTSTTPQTKYISNPSCAAKCVAVTLDPRDGLDETTEYKIYSKYADNSTWYSDEACSTATTTATVAVRTGGYVLAGYWSSSTRDEVLTDIEQDTILPASTSGLMRIAPPTSEDSSLMLLGVSKVTVPLAYAGKLSADETWYARWAKKCDAGAGALCLGPYYAEDDASGKRTVGYVNCCLPGYNKTIDGTAMDVSTDGATCPSDIS